MKNTQKYKKRTSYKAHTTTIIFFLILTLAQINMVFAFDFDNVKEYNNETKTVTIINSFGLGNNIANIQLITPQVNYVMRGKDRKVMIFEVENFGEVYKNGLKEMEIYNLNKNDLKESKDYYYEYAIYGDVEVNDYEDYCYEDKDMPYNTTICSKRVLGSHIENKIIRWERLGTTNIPKGNITISLVTDVKSLDYYDGIPNLFGIRISEWAVWEESYSVGLVSYWNFDENTGTFVEDIVKGTNNGTIDSRGTGGGQWMTGKLGSSFNFTGGVYTTDATWINTSIDSQLAGNVNGGNLTYAMWVYPTACRVSGNLFCKWTGSDGVQFALDASCTPAFLYPSAWKTAGNAIPVNTWSFVVVTLEDLEIKFYINGGLNGTETSLTWTDRTRDGTIGHSLLGDFYHTGRIDELGVWNRTLTAVEVNDLWNGGVGLTYSSGAVETIQTATTLISPIDDLETLNTSIIFDSNASITNGNLTNATLYIWNPDNSLFGTNFTIRTGTENSTNLSISLLTINDSYLWNVEWCGNNSGGSYNCSFATSNKTFDITILEITNETWVNSTIEGNAERFELNFTIVPGKQLSTAILVYNYTNYAPSIFTPTTNIYSLRANIVIPVVEADVNQTFFWNLVLSDGSEENTTKHNQTVYDLKFGNCSTYDTVLYNYTIFDEEYQTGLSNATIEIQINLYDALKTILIESFSQIYTQSFEASVCTNNSLLNATNYSVDSVVKYYSNETGVGNYAKEYYNLLGDRITNTSIPKNIKLYDLIETDSTEFQVTFRDADLVLSPNILLYLYRQYIVDNDFKVVEIPLTDSNGQTIVHLVRNDVVYNMVMVNANGEIVATFNKVIAFCQDFTIGECTLNLNALPTEGDVYNYTNDLGISYTTPTYSNTTDLVSMNFISLNLSSINVKMEVIRNSQFGNRSVCEDSLTSTTGTLSCGVSEITEIDRFIFVNLYVNNEYKATFTLDLEADNFNFGIVNGAFYAFLIILFIITMFMEEKQVLIISLGLGWIIIISMGLIKGALFGTVSSGIWLIVSIIIFLWKLKQEEKF